jgi:hypothetical protein
MSIQAMKKVLDYLENDDRLPPEMSNILLKAIAETKKQEPVAQLKRGWVSLTEDEAIELLPVGNWEIESTLYFAKAIEAKLREKNGG